MTTETRDLARSLAAHPQFEDLIREIKRHGTFQNGQVFVADFVEQRAAGYREAMDDLHRLINQIAARSEIGIEDSGPSDPFDSDDIIAARFGRLSRQS